MLYARRSEDCVRLILDLIPKMDYTTLIEGWKEEYEEDPRFELDMYYLDNAASGIATTDRIIRRQNPHPRIMWRFFRRRNVGRVTDSSQNLS